ncbi:MAG: response regulator [Acidobacteria bacterium]|nr:response regulator [Acidobacteriota bacterium]
MKLLIVDDMKSFLDLERAFLRRADCRLLTAATGLEAIKVAQTEKPDLIILDIEMPELDGIQATRILKANPGLASIPVVIFSSTSRKDEALAAGAQEFISKPVDEDRFLEIILKYVPLKFRKEERKETSLRCVFTFEHGQGEGRIADISVSGLLLATDAPMMVGQPVKLFFSLPVDAIDKEIQAEAIVVRKATGGYGLGFSYISEGAKLYLADFVKG